MRAAEGLNFAAWFASKTNKSFLVLFFKKELLPSTLRFLCSRMIERRFPPRVQSSLTGPIWQGLWEFDLAGHKLEPLSASGSSRIVLAVNSTPVYCSKEHRYSFNLNSGLS